MKRITVLPLITASLIIVFMACNSAPEFKSIPTLSKKNAETKKKTSAILPANKISVSMEIEGMVCEMGCAAKIEEKIAAMEGVVMSKVDYKSTIAAFEFDRSILSAEEIINRIAEINDGAYQATLISKKSAGNKREETHSVNSDRDSIGNEKKMQFKVGDEVVTSRVTKKMQSVNFPKLLTYFLESIR